jgi:hypothetical protein
VKLGFDLSEADAYALLSEWNQQCVPPWSEEELRKKLSNAKAYGDEPAGHLL